uniref:Transmembrane protein 242 n=1 Tax=Phallusia mammillata TaxID=59560 RepID=A0A6F9DV77_9ASCI|nr:transmembrane protein 242-like [Phallusia mammillata]
MEENTKPKLSSPTPIQSAGFIFGATGIAFLSGFAMMLAKSKRSDPGDIVNDKVPDLKNMESGGRLAMRALGRATVYSVGGFSLFCVTVCALLGVRNLTEFTAKMQSLMPKIPPGKNSTGEDVDWDELFGTKSKKEDVKHK